MVNKISGEKKPSRTFQEWLKYRYYHARKMWNVIAWGDDKLRIIRWREYNEFVKAFKENSGVYYDPAMDNHMLMAVFSSQLLMRSTCPLIVCCKSPGDSEALLIDALFDGLSHEELHRILARSEGLRTSSMLDKLTRRGQWNLVDDCEWTIPVKTPFMKMLNRNR